jgi:hypothetical protein
MRDVCSLIWLAVIGLFRSRASLQAEILTLRHQLNALRRKSPQRLTFTRIDRLVFAGLYRLAPGVLAALKIVRPETVIRWHRAGFRAYWRWKSRPRSGRPATPLEVRQLIREISLANPLWGVPRFMASFSSSASMSDKPLSQSIWRGEGDHRPRGGRRSFIITPTASRRWTYSWSRQSHSDCSTGC